MKFKNLLSVLVISLIITSCKKGNDFKIDPTEEDCDLKSIESNGIKTTYEYDSLERIKYYYGNTFSYLNGKVNFYGGGLKPSSYSTELVLDSAGNAISKKYKKFTLFGEVWEDLTLSTEYSYNPDQYLIKEVIVTETIISEQPYNLPTLTEEYNYEYENDDLITLHYTNSKGKEIIRKYTYTELPNQMAEFDRKLSFTGKKSKHLIRTIEEIINGADPIFTTYSYTFNSSGKLEMETVNQGRNNYTRKFVWNCQN